MKYILLFYAVPMIYGIFLLYRTSYRTILDKKLLNKRILNRKIANKNISWIPDRNIHEVTAAGTLTPSSGKCNAGFYIKNLFSSLHSSLEQITLLGGCMIIFNTIQIFPKKLNELLCQILPYHEEIPLFSNLLCSLIEIGGGLTEISTAGGDSDFLPVTLSLLTFGGLCCIFQTYTILENTGLSIKKYIIHKIIQSLLMFFVVWKIHINFFA